jgi:PEP-CTERM motif
MSPPLRVCLTAALVVLAGWSSAKAGIITPDSIGSPPAVSPAIQGSSVATNGWATNQYQGLGVVFPGRMTGVDTGMGTAVVVVNGARVWTGATSLDGPVISHVAFDGDIGVSADLVAPANATPVAVDHLRVDFSSTGPGLAYLAAYDLHGNLIQSTSSPIAGGGETALSLNVAGIHSLYATVYQAVIDPPVGANPGFGNGWPAAWGVRAIEWREAPEPAGLMLGGLGTMVLIAYAWRRRSMRLRCPAFDADLRPH